MRGCDCERSKRSPTFDASAIEAKAQDSLAQPRRRHLQQPEVGRGRAQPPRLVGLNDEGVGGAQLVTLAEIEPRSAVEHETEHELAVMCIENDVRRSAGPDRSNRSQSACRVAH